MVNKTISLSEEIYFKLKGEPNASALIDNLCRDYFSKKTNPETKLEALSERASALEAERKEVEDLLSAREKKERLLQEARDADLLRKQQIESKKRENAKEVLVSEWKTEPTEDEITEALASGNVFEYAAQNPRANVVDESPIAKAF